MLVVIAFSLIAVSDLPTLVRKKRLREVLSFSVIWLIGLVLSLVRTFGGELPNPVRLIEHIFGGPR